MRTPALLSLAVLSRHALTQRLQYDERTTKDCIGWADIYDSSVDTCESTLREWGVEPKRFHAWNPAVGLDCTPWFNLTSYCILTNETIEDSVYYTTLSLSDYSHGMPLASMTTDSDGWRIPVTKSDAKSHTTSTIAPIPSPSTWKDMGCYVDNWNDGENGIRTWILDTRWLPRDPEETVDKCKEKCHKMQYKIAGLKLGDECWCGDSNNGTLAADQKECNMPCGGDAKVMCGGTLRQNVFGAVDDIDESSSASVSTAVTASATNGGSAATGPTATATSGARRNLGLFGMWRR
ncbi:uncharacterized protein EKO05_0002793 [Ascochyta rabiei]|uniref:WSC domain-containing protein n=1 Tax=Didymella rabiei TaxID=5454 RepID=A0A163EHS6_DIDRA|nr:uncharacterized protein EKO05_0002793 [Ascochyta rabiei]KZM20136.1 hypothetical protein ST47_g8706 [Ascochyta rabiei]KZM23703.1 hypothetical protein ST47_g5191 [Ascochyta rabiei]UPX12236.1 hypothetical protein EKO05_0002793 [Ascochyta rabiei]